MNDLDTAKQSSRVWRWRRAVGDSDLPATTRDILRVLSEFMSRNGDSCFPAVGEIAKKSGRDRKTVREHLEIAENRGWLVRESAGWGGPQHARKSYVARWPDDVKEDLESDGETAGSAPAGAGECDPDRWGEAPHPDGVDFPTYNTSPLTSPNTSPDKNASAGALSPSDRARTRREFLLWLPKYPGFQNHSDTEARKRWMALSEKERRDCIRLTPAYIARLRKEHAPSPANYLRGRLWEVVPLQAGEEQPELVAAKSFSPLWMTARFDMLFQPPTGTFVFTGFDRGLIAAGTKTENEIRLEKQAVHGWPNVNAMIADMRKGKSFQCRAALVAISSELKPVGRDSELFLAWERAHARRGWPFFNFTPNYLPFPAVDLGVTNLDAAVDAAITGFAELINRV